jgi:hypothetical protein
LLFRFLKVNLFLLLKFCATPAVIHIPSFQKRPKIRSHDRLFWVLISRYWKNWKDAVIIVKPKTVIGWHRKGFKLFWTWKARKKVSGRPKIPLEIRNLIKTMVNENPTWGAPRIHGELFALGIAILPGQHRRLQYFILNHNNLYDTDKAWTIKFKTPMTVFLKKPGATKPMQRLF